MSRRVLVTGASRGIGLAIVDRLLSEGCEVVAVARSRGELVEGPRCTVVTADVRKLPDLGPIDHAVCCAATSPDVSLLALDEATLRHALAVNVDGARVAAERATRSAVLLGSLYGTGCAGNAAYAISKGALRGVAVELSRPDRPVHLLIPGFVPTRLTEGLSDEARKLLVDLCPAGRVGTPEEVAAAAWHLLRGGLGPLHITGGLLEAPR